MKKLLLVIALFVSVNASALEIKLHKVSYYHETLGNKSAESKARKTTLDNYKKLGYTFNGMVINEKGKFMKFVK